MSDGPGDPSRFDVHVENWNLLAARQPFWSVISYPGAETAEYDAEAFFADGRGFVDWLAQLLDRVGAVPGRRVRALDFGCGLGRLSQALAEHFEEVDGVDVARPMVERARVYNRHGDRCRYHHNERLDLALFPDATFDMVLSVLVLQHMRPDFMLTYLREFLRVLRPGGTLFFQVPLCPLIPEGHGAEPEVVPAPARTGPHRASLRVRPKFTFVYAGTVKDLQVVVQNHGDSPLPLRWPEGGVEVRAEWRAPSGVVVPAEGGARASFSGSLLPGDAAASVLTVACPTEVGDYRLEVFPAIAGPHAMDLAVDRFSMPVVVRRFEMANAGEGAAEGFRASVVSRRDRAAGDEPEMEVYDVDVDEVRELIRECGGRIVHEDEDDWAGPCFVSGHFTVVKDG